MNITILNAHYADTSKSQIVASIIVPEINGDEPFDYFVSIADDDSAEIFNYIKNSILSNELKVEEFLQPKMSAEDLCSSIRQERDLLLQSTDKYMIEDYPISKENKDELKIYRQTLRDITDQESFPEHTVWPEKPEWLDS